MRRDPGIPGVLPLHHASQIKTRRQLHGHVLEGVHRQIGTAFLQGHFELLDKEPLAAHLAQRPVQDLVALGRHAEQGNGVPLSAQQRLNVFGLPERQAAFTGGNGEGQRNEIKHADIHSGPNFWPLQSL